MTIDNEIITRYLTGNSLPGECDALLDWVEQSEENKKAFAEAKNAWTISLLHETTTDETITREQFHTLLGKIDTTPETTGRKFRINSLIRWAASLIITVGLTAWVSYLVWNKKEDKITYHELSVPSGQQAQLTLSDGTKIWLNSKSKLVYPGTFSAGTREVELEGEGYFQVSHNPEKPFIVKTSHLDIRVLGTSFNVTNYNDEDNIVLSLESGAVRITEHHKTENGVQLKPDEMAVYSKTSRDIRLSRADSDVYKSWLKGQFKFRNLSFEDISRRLGRNFNVEFVFVNEKVKKIKYSGSFYNYEPLNQILNIMQTNSAFRYRIVKDKVYIE